MTESAAPPAWELVNAQPHGRIAASPVDDGDGGRSVLVTLTKEGPMLLMAPRIRLGDAPTRARIKLRPGRPTAADPLAIAAAAICGMALGLLLGYFLDRDAGRRRRHTARDRAIARMRRGERRAAMRARRTESRAAGLARRTVNAARRGEREPLDDVTLAHKVESELYRRTGIPKGHISVNAEDGCVFLRGVLDRQEDIERIAAATRQIPGVREVENLTHLPGTPAPASRPKSERVRSGNGQR